MGSGEETRAKTSKQGDPHKVDTPGVPGRGGDPHQVPSEFGRPKEGGDPYKPDVPSGSQADQLPPRESPREPRIDRKA